MRSPWLGVSLPGSQQVNRKGGRHTNIPLIVWIVLLVVFLAAEAASAQLLTIWFAAGALVALLAAICKAPQWLQIVLFFAVSVISLAATRPLVKKLVTAKKQPTNVDRCIGKTAIVTETIDNTLGRGIASVEGVSWTARSADGTVIDAGEKVTVQKIEGVKLIVKM